jgi:hypothetical protein
MIFPYALEKIGFLLWNLLLDFLAVSSRVQRLPIVKIP